MSKTKRDGFSEFIISKVLEGKELTEKEVNLFQALASGSGITPKRVYNETLTLFNLYLTSKDQESEANYNKYIGILDEISSLAEYDDFFNQAKLDAMVSYSRDQLNLNKIITIMRMEG